MARPDRRHGDAASDLFSILANRELRGPALIASQPGPDYWASALSADSIMSRLVDNARTTNLGDIDMRHQRGEQARQAEGFWE